MKTPGPDHPITIAPNPHRVRVIWRGRIVADTTRALALKEASYPLVQYIPRADADPSPSFAALRELAAKYRPLFAGEPWLSMGMSHDFQLAIRHGATHVRVGASIFGARTA